MTIILANLCTSNLGSGRDAHFQRCDELADIENAISNKKWAVELTLTPISLVIS
jgi:hypothetical protein